MKKPIFSNKEVGALLSRFGRHPHSLMLRNEIMMKVDPLIDAAISKKRLFHLRDDLHQECFLKVVGALHHYNPNRGAPFAFFWTTICNTCITQGKKLSKTNLSLSEEEVKREAEVMSTSHFHSPEKTHILNVLSGVLDDAFRSNGLRSFVDAHDRKAIAYLQQSVRTGDFFHDRPAAVKQIRRFGVRKKDAEFFCDYVLVTLRAKLYSRRDIAKALSTKPVREANETALSEII